MQISQPRRQISPYSDLQEYSIYDSICMVDHNENTKVGNVPPTSMLPFMGSAVSNVPGQRIFMVARPQPSSQRLIERYGERLKDKDIDEYARRFDAVAGRLFGDIRMRYTPRHVSSIDMVTGGTRDELSCEWLDDGN